jgi:hypothetical protein
MEEKKLLSFVEKAGLLSQAEKAGVTLSKVEELKLLSTAERCARCRVLASSSHTRAAHMRWLTHPPRRSLGLLSLAESAASTDGALISSLSIPFLLVAVAAVVLIPDQNIALVVVQDLLAASMLAGAGALFVTGLLVNALNE